MMIKSIDEFKNTYVKNTPELRDAFLGVALHFGLIDSASDIGQSSADAVVAYWHDVNGDFFNVGCWYHYAGQIKEECRELTLSDLKLSKEESAVKTLEMLGYVYHGAELWEPPVKKLHTRTEYERVTESASHVIDEFENGGKFYYTAPSLTKPALANRDGVFNKLRDGDALYRKVEKEIDERQEFVDAAIEYSYYTGSTETELILLENMYDSGKFRLAGVNGEIE